MWRTLFVLFVLFWAFGCSLNSSRTHSAMQHPMTMASDRSKVCRFQPDSSPISHRSGEKQKTTKKTQLKMFKIVFFGILLFRAMKWYERHHRQFNFGETRCMSSTAKGLYLFGFGHDFGFIPFVLCVYELHFGLQGRHNKTISATGRRSHDIRVKGNERVRKLRNWCYSASSFV